MPLAPTGCPNAIAPPLTFTLPCPSPCLDHLNGLHGKSFIDFNESRSLTVMPSFCSSFLLAV